MNDLTRIQLRRGTQDDWTIVDPVLAAGEPGVVIGNQNAWEKHGKIKIGDGLRPWNALPYTNDSQALGYQELMQRINEGSIRYSLEIIFIPTLSEGYVNAQPLAGERFQKYDEKSGQWLKDDEAPPLARASLSC